MNSEPSSETRSPLTKFLDSFLQERNIQWVLAAGMTIVLGSTLMLVVTHWDAYTPVWKYLIMLAYTSSIYVVGQWSYRHVGLRKTGTVLMALTVLLLPVMFLALHWVQGPTLGARELAAAGARNVGESGLLFSGLSSFAGPGMNLVLFGITIAFAMHASSRVFTHFLRKRQLTFLVSYLVLCVSGTFAPAVPVAYSPWASLVLWGVFTLGTVKVNRHVFWLTEERAAPRIFGFFPIALLGAQFFSLFALNFASHVPLEWLGFGSVLVAVPILLTADSVAHVFQRRTGGIVRPLPWPIMVPFLAGLVLCVSGVCMSAAGLVAPRSPYALAPTAALAAAMLFLVSRRTERRPFVWAMLAALTVAYNFSPVFFQQVARLAVQMGAEAVREQQLPYAFYGLTYLPLISVLTVVGTVAGRRGNELFAQPVRVFSIALGCLLLGASLGHVKAMFPVAAVMAVTFGVQTICFRRPGLAIAAVLAWLIAAYGATPFMNAVFQLALPRSSVLVCLAGAAATLLIPGEWIDRRLRTLGSGGISSGIVVDWSEASVCKLSSLFVSLVVAMHWVATYLDIRTISGRNPVELMGIISGLALATLLLVHGWRWVQPLLSGVAIVFVYVVGVTISLRNGIPIRDVGSVVTLLLLAQWLASYALARLPRARVASAFESANKFVCMAGLSVAFATFLPFSLSDMLCVSRIIPAIESITPWLLCRVLVVAWCFDAAPGK